MTSRITVEASIHAKVEKTWKYWTEAEHIVKWNFASDDWCCPRVTNDLRVGGKFNCRMEAKDGDAGFDFEGTYTDVEEKKKIGYTMVDGRSVSIEFIEEEDGCKVVETFDAEDENPSEVQRAGWQSILDAFKKYVEHN